MLLKVITLVLVFYCCAVSSSSTCKDTNKHCASWAKTGECKKNPSYMLKSCKLSCGTCRNVGATKPPTPEICRDSDAKFCAAEKSNCIWNSKVMSKKCKLTCKMCSPLANCFDKNSFCPKWKEQGKCDRGSDYRPWMLDNCKFTCTHCGKKFPTTKPPTPEICRDSDPKFCAAEKSNCIWNGKVMSQKCKLTCKMCSPSTKCFDKNSYCPKWKEQGNCDKDSIYLFFMMEDCKYTCTQCGKLPLPTKAPTKAPTKVPTKAPTKLPPPPKCRDTDTSFCSLEQGQCFNKNDVMSKKCMKTCKMCSPTSKCFDKDSYCPKWKEFGYCKNGQAYQPFMMDNCKYTCTGC